MWSYNYTVPSNELYHHGIMGMKWGVRKSTQRGVSLAKKIGNNHQYRNEGSNTRTSRNVNNFKKREGSKKQINAIRKNKAKSIAKNFISTVGNQVIKPALINVGRQEVEKMLRSGLQTLREREAS